MRASIACERCRRSKTKCVNDGTDTKCKACEAHPGRTCTYPPPASGGHARRDSTLSSQLTLPGHAPADSEPSRKRMKRTLAPTSQSTSTPKSSPDDADDPLNPKVLTWAVWKQLFDIFQKHYSADLPFLHAPTFLCPELPQPRASRKLLLAFLALTAPSHPDLVRHRSPDKENPRVAADFYYQAAYKEVIDAFEHQNLEGVQTMLMLAMYETNSCNGKKAWQRIGLAVRDAHALGLHEQSTYTHKERGPSERTKGSSKEDIFIRDEIKRRTYWACFVLDRLQSGSVSKPSTVDLQMVTIQLPCSARAFVSGKVVRTARLTPALLPEYPKSENGKRHYRGNGHGTGANDPDPKSLNSIPWEHGLEEGVLCHYERAIELFKDTQQWSVHGGRRNEEFPPWDKRCTVSKIEEKLDQLKRILGDYSLSTHNTRSFLAETSPTTTPYILLHALHLVCVILLHREYIPFDAYGCIDTGPRGPLDEPQFTVEQYGDRKGYWDDSATKLCMATRDFIELFKTCREWDHEVESPVLSFVAYQFAVCCVYIDFFPWMDPKNVLPKTDRNWGKHLIRERQKKSLQTREWYRTLLRLGKRYENGARLYRSYRKTVDTSSESSSGVSDMKGLAPFRGGSGGGLAEYQADWERDLKQFGDMSKGGGSNMDSPDYEEDVKGPDDLSDQESFDVHNRMNPVQAPLPMRPDPRPEGTGHHFTPVNATNPNTPSSMTSQPAPSHLPDRPSVYQPQYGQVYGPHLPNDVYLQPVSADRDHLNPGARHQQPMWQQPVWTPQQVEPYLDHINNASSFHTSSEIMAFMNAQPSAAEFPYPSQDSRGWPSYQPNP